MSKRILMRELLPPRVTVQTDSLSLCFPTERDWHAQITVHLRNMPDFIQSLRAITMTWWWLALVRPDWVRGSMEHRKD